jgi:hypothetical protein
MKTIHKSKLFAAIAAAVTLLVASCAKEPVVPEPPAGGIPLHVSFADAGLNVDTRAWFDDTPTAEPWEKKLHSLVVYVFGDDNQVLMFKRLSVSERDAMKGLLLLPESSAGTRCTVLAVANVETREYQIPSLDNFINTSEVNLSRYNDRFSYVSGGRTPVYGFAMTGKAEITVGDANAASEASVTLRRLTAKLAVRIGMASDFQRRHGGGKAWVQQIQIRKAARIARLFPESELPGDYRTETLSQQAEVVGTTSRNLFYLYPQGPCAPGDESLMRLTVVFDQDGSTETTADRIYKTADIPIAGSGAGEIVRNGYYRVSGTITDFGALNLNTAFQATDWETPVTGDCGNIALE